MSQPAAGNFRNQSCVPIIEIFKWPPIPAILHAPALFVCLYVWLTPCSSNRVKERSTILVGNAKSVITDQRKGTFQLKPLPWQDRMSMLEAGDPTGHHRLPCVKRIAIQSQWTLPPVLSRHMSLISKL